MKLLSRGEEDTDRPTSDTPWIINAFFSSSLFREGEEEESGGRQCSAAYSTVGLVMREIFNIF